MDGFLHRQSKCQGVTRHARVNDNRIKGRVILEPGYKKARFRVLGNNAAILAGRVLWILPGKKPSTPECWPIQGGKPVDGYEPVSADLSFRCSQTAKKSGVSLGRRNLTVWASRRAESHSCWERPQSRVRYSIGRLGMVFAAAFHPEISSPTSFPARVGRSYLPVICRLSPGNKEK